MGARLCTLLHPISDKKSKSHGARDGTTTSCKEFITPKYFKVESQRRSKTENVRRKEEMEKAPEKKNVTLEDWIKASPGMNLKRGELSNYASNKQSKKKVHPACLSHQCHGGSLLSEAKDSLYLDRPWNHHEEESKEISECSSIMRSFSGKSQKSVSFKLAHDVIFYSPDEPYCKEASSSEETTCGSEDSFGSTEEEPVVRLAVDTLPHLF